MGGGGGGGWGGGGGETPQISVVPKERRGISYSIKEFNQCLTIIDLDLDLDLQRTKYV